MTHVSSEKMTALGVACQEKAILSMSDRLGLGIADSLLQLESACSIDDDYAAVMFGPLTVILRKSDGHINVTEMCSDEGQCFDD